MGARGEERKKKKNFIAELQICGGVRRDGWEARLGVCLIKSTRDVTFT